MPQKMLRAENQRGYPLIGYSPIKLQRRGIDVITELHGVHRQNTEIVPLTRPAPRAANRRSNRRKSWVSGGSSSPR